MDAAWPVLQGALKDAARWGSSADLGQAADEVATKFCSLMSQLKSIVGLLQEHQESITGDFYFWALDALDSHLYELFQQSMYSEDPWQMEADPATATAWVQWRDYRGAWDHRRQLLCRLKWLLDKANEEGSHERQMAAVQLLHEIHELPFPSLQPKATEEEEASFRDRIMELVRVDLPVLDTSQLSEYRELAERAAESGKELQLFAREVAAKLDGLRPQGEAAASRSAAEFGSAAAAAAAAYLGSATAALGSDYHLLESDVAKLDYWTARSSEAAAAFASEAASPFGSKTDSETVSPNGSETASPSGTGTATAHCISAGALISGNNTGPGTIPASDAAFVPEAASESDGSETVAAAPFAAPAADATALPLPTSTGLSSAISVVGPESQAAVCVKRHGGEVDRCSSKVHGSDSDEDYAPLKGADSGRDSGAEEPAPPVTEPVQLVSEQGASAVVPSEGLHGLSQTGCSDDSLAVVDPCADSVEPHLPVESPTVESGGELAEPGGEDDDTEGDMWPDYASLEGMVEALFRPEHSCCLDMDMAVAYDNLKRRLEVQWQAHGGMPPHKQQLALRIATGEFLKRWEPIEWARSLEEDT